MGRGVRRVNCALTRRRWWAGWSVASGELHRPRNRTQTKYLFRPEWYEKRARIAGRFAAAGAGRKASCFSGHGPGFLARKWAKKTVPGGRRLVRGARPFPTGGFRACATTLSRPGPKKPGLVARRRPCPAPGRRRRRKIERFGWKKGPLGATRREWSLMVDKDSAPRVVGSGWQCSIVVGSG